MTNETYYPSFSENIQLQEYEKVKDIINKKYNTNNSALEIRAEFEKIYNKLFEIMYTGNEEKVFHIIWLFMETFNVDEVKAIRYLNKDNYNIVKKYAKANTNTIYYENIEKNLAKQKIDKKMMKFKKKINNIMDLFE